MRSRLSPSTRLLALRQETVAPASKLAAAFTTIAVYFAEQTERAPGATDEECAEEVRDLVDMVLGPAGARLVDVEFLRRLRKSGRPAAQWASYTRTRLALLPDVMALMVAANSARFTEAVTSRLIRGHSTQSIYRAIENGELPR